MLCRPGRDNPSAACARDVQVARTAATIAADLSFRFRPNEQDHQARCSTRRRRARPADKTHQTELLARVDREARAPPCVGHADDEIDAGGEERGRRHDVGTLSESNRDLPTVASARALTGGPVASRNESIDQSQRCRGTPERSLGGTAIAVSTRDRLTDKHQCARLSARRPIGKGRPAHPACRSRCRMNGRL